MEQRFPRTRADGSFCIIAKFEITHETASISERVASWLSKWVEAHQVWTRKWEGAGESEKEQLYYFDDFSAPPYIFKLRDNQIYIRIDCKPGAKWWKDWSARIFIDLSREFPELKRLPGLEDCE